MNLKIDLYSYISLFFLFSLRNNADLTISAVNNRLRNAQAAAAANQQQAIMSVSATQPPIHGSTSGSQSSSHQHRKSQSLDASAISAQLNADGNAATSNVVKPKSSGHIRER